MTAKSAIFVARLHKKSGRQPFATCHLFVFTILYFVESSIGGSLVVLSLTSTEIFD